MQHTFTVSRQTHTLIVSFVCDDRFQFDVICFIQILFIFGTANLWLIESVGADGTYGADRHSKYELKQQFYF